MHLRSSSFLPLCPRGPRSGPSYSVSVHPHLIDPIRPTCGHIPTSSLCGLYEMPSLCAVPSTPRRPASGSVLSLAILFRHVVLRDPGKFIGCMYPVPSPMTLAFDQRRRSRPFQLPHPPILVGACFRGLTTVRFRYDLSICSPSCRS
jgi:hypothetical protein